MSVAWIMKCDSDGSQSPWSQTSDSGNFHSRASKICDKVEGLPRWCSETLLAGGQPTHQDWSNSHASLFVPSATFDCQANKMTSNADKQPRSRTVVSPHRLCGDGFRFLSPVAVLIFLLNTNTAVYVSCSKQCLWRVTSNIVAPISAKNGSPRT